MTDLTASISSLLTTVHNSKPVSPAPPSHTVQTLDSFLLEARQINASIRSLLSYLRALRGPYLSTAPAPKLRRTHPPPTHTSTTPNAVPDIPSHLTDPQREAIDSQTSTLLRDLSNSLTNLRNAVTLKHDTALQRLAKQHKTLRPNALMRWAAGATDSTTAAQPARSAQHIQEAGAEDTLYAFRDGVLWYLNHWLERAVRTQQEMVTIRLEREREKRASILYDQANRNIQLPRSSQQQSQQPHQEQDDIARFGTGDMQAHDTYDPALDTAYTNTTTAATTTYSPPAAQLQLFEQENSTLITHYTDQLTQITQTEKSLLEISSLQQTLLNHLTVQGELIDTLAEDAHRTDENVTRGNKELKRAVERPATARLMYHATLWICGGLILWDLVF